MRWALLFSIALLLGGCQRRYVECRSEYLYPEYLASKRADTPDPCRECFYGQQIIVHWNLPRCCLDAPVTLRLHVRYGNREIETLTMLVEKRKGWKIHRLLNQDYWCRGGILAFQAQLLQGGEVLDDWTHYLWADIIEISSES